MSSWQCNNCGLYNTSARSICQACFQKRTSVVFQCIENIQIWSTRSVTIGYIRNIQTVLESSSSNDNSQYHIIPNEIINICLTYVHSICIEKFSIFPNGIDLDDDQRTIINSTHGTKTGYGSQIIECYNNSNAYLWKLRINKFDMKQYRRIIIGIDEANALNKTLVFTITDQSWSYGYDCVTNQKDGRIFKINRFETRTNIPKFYENDNVIMILDLLTKTLHFALNGTFFYIQNDIETKYRKYRLAVNVQSDVSVTIMEFMTIYQ